MVWICFSKVLVGFFGRGLDGLLLKNMFRWQKTIIFVTSTGESGEAWFVLNFFGFEMGFSNKEH